MHSSGATAISGGMAPAFLSMPGHLRHPHDLQGHQIASFNGHGLPIHPAFQFQTYPFYPTGLLAAIRPPGSSAIQKSSLRDTASTKSSGSKSFTIDAILASDKDDDVSSREGTPEVDPDEKEAVVAAGAHAQDASRPPPLVGTRRPEVMNPFSGHAQGLAHCPAAAIRYAHFNPGNRPEKKHGHVTGNTWKGKSKRVRTIFTPEQLERLEAEFERQQYMVGTERYYLAASLNLTEAQVKVWFQNRRIKWRKQNLEQQHAKMAQFDLFTPEEGSDSDGDIGDRKYDDGRGDHVTTQDGEVMAEVTNRNASFDSGISVDRSKLNEETNRCDHVTGSVTRINDLDKVNSES